MHSESGIIHEEINVKVIVAVLLAGSFVAILNQTLLATALPHIMVDLNIDANQVQWLTTVFLLTNGVMIPITAFLIEKFSTRRLYLTAISLFALGTFIAAVAPNFPVLVTARIVQASGAGIMMPLMQTVFLVIFPVNKRGFAMGMSGLVIGFAPAIGPTLAGWLVDHYSWRFLFYLVLPISVLDIIFALIALKNVIKITNPRVDLPSILLSSIGFGGLLYGFSLAGSDGWGSSHVLTSLSAGAVALTIFIRRQLLLDKPLLEFRVFKQPIFTLATIITMIIFISLIGVETVLPIYVQTTRGYPALYSGLLLLPGAVLTGLMNPVSGLIFDKFGARGLGIAGFSLLSLGTLPFTFLDQATSLSFIAFMFAVRMLGLSLVMMPMTTAALNQLGLHLIHHGTAMINTMRQVAGSIGTALLITIMSITAAASSAPTQNLAMIAGINKAFFFTFMLAIMGLILSLFMKNSNPASGSRQPDGLKPRQTAPSRAT
jgi:EmrB/QacA subfamily drug resistance transporter